VMSVHAHQSFLQAKVHHQHILSPKRHLEQFAHSLMCAAGTLLKWGFRERQAAHRAVAGARSSFHAQQRAQQGQAGLLAP